MSEEFIVYEIYMLVSFLCYLKGALDLTVLLVHKPNVYLVVGEVSSVTSFICNIIILYHQSYVPHISIKIKNHPLI